MNVQWVRIKSWHALSGLVSRAGGQQTRCGRWVGADAAIVDELPAGKSCESCLRLVTRDADRSPVDNDDAGS